MTDFLTSLTARSFGRETAIRPRVASLFEPVRNGDAAFREAPAAEPVETAIAREVEVESDGERKMNHPAPALQEDCKVSDANSMSDVDYKQVGARGRLMAEQNVGTRASELLVNERVA